MADALNGKINDHATFIWGVANTLRNHFRAGEYGKTILPMTVLRRLDCVIEPKADAIKAAADKLSASTTDTMRNRALNRKAGARFHSVSGLTLTRLLADPDNIRANLKTYINGLSPNIRVVFIEHFEFLRTVDRLEKQGILYSVVKHFASVDLSPARVTTIDMGYIFENLLRRFNEASNAASGEHFTPREVIQLMTSLLFSKDGEVLASKPRVVSIHDPACGSGGMLATAEAYLKNLNKDLDVDLFGQEVNPESFAICRSDMLITDHDPDNIQIGNTLTDDRFRGKEFAYQLCNPPYGTSYETEYPAVLAEHERGGGRFDVAIPAKDDGQLLFLLHMISKMPPKAGRIAIIMSGSPLFNDSAGGKQSEIRRFIFENDLLEGLVALPTGLFYNTQIGTYVWILCNHKHEDDAGRVRLVNAISYWGPMKKNLGSKNRELTQEHIGNIVRLYMDGEDHEDVRTMTPADFGYRKITIERPLRLDVDLTESGSGRFRNTSELDEYFLWMAQTHGGDCHERLTQIKAEVTQYVEEQTGLARLRDDQAVDKADLARAQKQARKFLKPLLDSKQHQERCVAMRLIRDLRGQGQTTWLDYNQFVGALKAHARQKKVSLPAACLKMIRAWVARTNPEAERVIARDVTDKHQANERFGCFQSNGRVVTFERDTDLADTERVPLKQDIVDYFEAEVLPHVGDAWINPDKRDHKDGKVGVVGYEINFNRYFYRYVPPRPLEDIDRDLAQVEKEIAELLAEVTE